MASRHSGIKYYSSALPCDDKTKLVSRFRLRAVVVFVMENNKSQGKMGISCKFWDSSDANPPAILQ